MLFSALHIWLEAADTAMQPLAVPPACFVQGQIRAGAVEATAEATQ